MNIKRQFNFSSDDSAYMTGQSLIMDGGRTIWVKNKNVIKFKNSPYIIAEIGINHNGYLNLAKKMVLKSKQAGADAVKFRKEMQKNWLIIYTS